MILYIYSGQLVSCYVGIALTAQTRTSLSSSVLYAQETDSFTCILHTN